MLQAYPGDERIAVLATGGLSHEPGGPRYFFVDEDFDRWFLDLLAKGDHETVLRECTLERMEAAGSGGTAELNAWVMAMAFTRGPADVLAYMPAVAWRTGTGMVTSTRARSTTSGTTRSRRGSRSSRAIRSSSTPATPPTGSTRAPPPTTTSSAACFAVTR
jgi:hypothetical protein